MSAKYRLARLGGAQPELLHEVPGEVPRHTSMGAVLIGTACVAAVSASFALDTAVGMDAGPAIVVGLLWGLLILNLDRMLVVSMARRAGTLGILATALPRVLLALLIGTVISVPLVLRIFQPEIEAKLQAIHSENLIANRSKIEEQFKDIATDQARADRLQAVASGQTRPSVSDVPDVKAAEAAVATAQKAYDDAAAKAQCELVGSCGTEKAGQGEAWRSAQANAQQKLADLRLAQRRAADAQERAQQRIGDSADASRQNAQTELRTLLPALQARKDARADAQSTLEKREADNEGLLARLEALDRLTEDRPTMALAHWALLLLFACIELLPVLVKLLSSGGPKSTYEQLADQREAEVLATDRRHAADRQAETGMEADERREAARIGAEERLEEARLQGELRRRLSEDLTDRQLAVGREANARTVATQQEAVLRAVDAWAAVARHQADQVLAGWQAQHAPSLAGTPQHTAAADVGSPKADDRPKAFVPSPSAPAAQPR